MSESETPKSRTIKRRMPAEWEPHEGTLMIWPTRPGSWGSDTKKARKSFLKIFENILQDEKLFVLAGSEHVAEVEEALIPLGCLTPKAVVMAIPTDDSWARDVGPTYIYETLVSDTTKCSADTDSERNLVRKGVNWSFNAWGGTVDGLYASWELDDRAAARFLAQRGDLMVDAAPFVLEGGSIHSDGEGTILTTEACLLSEGRNPELSKEQIEERLAEYLGAEKVLWLPHGIWQDETNEHIDNVACFIGPAEVVLAWTDNTEDPQYAYSKEAYDYLSAQTDAKGRPIKIHKLPIPDHPVCVTEAEVNAYVFEEGEDMREPGERLAASYVNFYYTNHKVLVPQFGHGNEESDARALKILKELIPDREIVGIPARAILLGGGNIHCITQQIPESPEKGTFNQTEQEETHE